MGKPFLDTIHTVIDVVTIELIVIRVFNESVVTKFFEPSEYFDIIMACLYEEGCEDLKYGSCFALMMARRKNKR